MRIFVKLALLLGFFANVVPLFWGFFWDDYYLFAWRHLETLHGRPKYYLNLNLFLETM